VLVTVKTAEATAGEAAIKICLMYLSPRSLSIKS